MPELTNPTELRDVDLELVDYLWADQTLDDRTAVSLVEKTFNQYESGRQTQEARWCVAERLYHGVVEERVWEGTQKKRASLPVPIVFDQVETAFPIITEALFEYYPTFFDVQATKGSTPKEAAELKEVFSSWLDAPFDESGMTAVPALEKAIRQAEIYGDGAIEISWDVELQRPIIEWVDIRDLYMDPTTPGPLIDWSPAVIRRRFLTVQQLEDMRGSPGVKIPPKSVLNYLSKCRYYTGGDRTRMQQASARKEAMSFDLPTDPRHQPVEVLQYWSKDRMIWVLGRRWAMVNRENPNGFVPICKAPFIEAVGRPWSISVPDVLEGEQKYAQGIRNARLDNLALALHPPRTRAQGAPTSPSKSGWFPGALDEVAKPEEVVVQKVENFTQDAYREEMVIHQGAAKRLGINEGAQSGVPTPSNANRSATGVNQQAMSVTRRLRTAVKNFEQYLIVPMLYKMQWMAQKFAPETIDIQASDGSAMSVPKTSLLHGVKFQMQAASRMVVRDRLAMFLQPISMLLFNEAVTHQANLQGKTIDFGEWERFFQDATATSKTYQFFRSMSSGEEQKLNQPDPKTQAMMAMKQQDAQTRMQMGQMKAQTEMAKVQATKDSKDNEVAEYSATELVKLLLEALRKNDDTGEESNSGSGKRARSGGAARSSRKAA